MSGVWSASLFWWTSEMLNERRKGEMKTAHTVIRDNNIKITQVLINIRQTTCINHTSTLPQPTVAHPDTASLPDVRTFFLC